jgi:hypothetical protein
VAARAGQVWQSQCMRLIGADGGLSGSSVLLGSTDVLVIAPGQRRDVMIDLSSLPGSVSRMRLVNLSVKSFLRMDRETPEAIYTTFADSVLVPSGAHFQNADSVVYGALDLPLATVMRLTLGAAAAVLGARADARCAIRRHRRQCARRCRQRRRLCLERHAIGPPPRALPSEPTGWCCW